MKNLKIQRDIPIKFAILAPILATAVPYVHLFLTSGKQTVLTILAREKDPASWDRFVKSKSDIQGYKEYYELSEVKIETKKLIDKFISKSQINLDVVPKEKRDALKSFSQLILNRKF